MPSENKIQAKGKLNKAVIIGVIAVIAIALVTVLAIFLPKAN